MDSARRPINQSTFNLHLLGNTDPVGVTDHFTIVKDGRVTPNNFLVFIYNDSLSTLYNGVSVVPSGNPMSGGIDMGQELAGARDASATRANFTRNIWAVQALGPEYVFFGIAARQPRAAFPARLRQPALGLRTRRHRRRKVVNSQRVAAGSCSGEQAMSK